MGWPQFLVLTFPSSPHTDKPCNQALQAQVTQQRHTHTHTRTPAQQLPQTWGLLLEVPFNTPPPGEGAEPIHLPARPL